jgi:two-component system NtrC family response regulator
MAKIMVIDDDKMICTALSSLLTSKGNDVSHALTLKAGLDEILSTDYDLVVLDVRLPDGNGLEAIPRIKNTPSSPEVIIITGEGTPDGAEVAIKSGAWDYIQKPLSPQKIELPLKRVLQYREKKESSQPPVALKREGIIGDSQPMRSCYDLIARASQTEANVLLQGESGTGKELFAKAIHANSLQRDNAFVVIDCAALPDTLIESVLFGHEKGAFTGADKPSEGLLKEAHQGTLFLDEVVELPLDMQSSFLRVLQERRFRPIGSIKEVRSSFRLIAATNRNLDEMVANGSFRQDLYFRLQSIIIDLPPLRNRAEDINDIAFHYMGKFCNRYAMGTKGFSPEFLEVLSNYDWPGNVRELINALERSLSMAGDEPTLYPIHLPIHIRTKLARASLDPGHPERADFEARFHFSGLLPKFQELSDRFEKQYLQDLVSYSNGDIKKICSISGLSRSQVYRLFKKHHISKQG